MKDGRERLYLYVIASNEEEKSLRMLEMRSLLGQAGNSNLVQSAVRIDPSRSPFIKQRLEILFEGGGLDELAEHAASIELEGATFKVLAIDNDNPVGGLKLDYDRKRELERAIGLRIRGKAEMRAPDRVFGFARVGGTWKFGELVAGEALWLKHNEKPRKYSTALSTRVARAIVNVAAPRTEDTRVIDPCCGIGTVLVEAMSMGIDIEGREINPLAAVGARENLAYFGYGSAKVALGDMREISEKYDVAIIDMPYNLCSVLPYEEKLHMLRSARGFADRMVLVTIESLDSLLEEAGFTIVDRCTVNKGKFSRQVLVCE
ncbi:TRM11 family SAM-dependent methyltransferase [Cohnella lupini]|uniref:tRNA G10 N-methylase Trm11 n=1 Tax=Cohnella lupini TaxID=1294267 RepID=A0A3D9IN36_9BACL|nr:RsmD family RNA methyltransferase [Cohnella lupini]RED63172.1 tRNA G10 N-methylase Trm11 [Cohnella lupini]